MKELSVTPLYVASSAGIRLTTTVTQTKKNSQWMGRSSNATREPKMPLPRKRVAKDCHTCRSESPAMKGGTVAAKVHHSTRPTAVARITQTKASSAGGATGLDAETGDVVMLRPNGLRLSCGA